MPVPALPYEEPTTSVESGVAVLWTRSYLDPQLRPYSGRVTAKRLDPPYLSTEAEVTPDGVVRLALEPGRYSVAMLRDVNGTRAYQAEEIAVTQEDS
jgi:hypothetical protein